MNSAAELQETGDWAFTCAEAWPADLVWTEDEAYRAYSSRAQFGFEEAAFDSSVTSISFEAEDEQLLQHGEESSAWIPVFEEVTSPQHAGSLAPAVAVAAASGLTHTATQTEPTKCSSTGCQTSEFIPRDASTQTDDFTSDCIPALGDGLDSLGQFLQQEQSLAKVRAHKRLLLFRLLREFRASHSLAIHITQPGQQASRASQTDSPCCPSQDMLQRDAGATEDWSPFVGACKQPFSVASPLARAQSFPAAEVHQGEMLTQQLQPAASAPHPIDDLIGVPPVTFDDDAIGVVPSLLQQAYASALPEDEAAAGSGSNELFREDDATAFDFVIVS